MAGELASGAPEAASAVRALNEHVAVNPDFFGTRVMGHHLREALGERYLALGMLFGEGAFLARSWEERRVSEFQMGQAGKGHVERCGDDDQELRPSARELTHSAVRVATTATS